MSAVYYIIAFIVFWLLLLIVGGFFINGWYTITRGEYEEQVDGSRKKVGKIFKGWYFFWFKEKEDKKLTQYMGSHLIGMYQQIKGMLSAERMLQLYPGFIMTDETIDPFISNIESRLSVKAVLVDDEIEGRKRLFLYKESTDYVFPDWVRTVLAGCITCFSSIYGTIVFFTAHALMYNKLHAIYSWADNVYVAIFFVWISSLMIWAYLNTLFYKWAKF